jgi:hydrogenase nickel incorporation protein HypA/HybF
MRVDGLASEQPDRRPPSLMHELAISRAILDAAARQADGRRVLVVNVTLGALRQVVAESLVFNFEILSRGTACEGARLQARSVAARLRCACGEEWEPHEPRFRCPSCGGAQVRVLDGDQLSVDYIEVEEEQCTAPR